jgi:hypothetical protein
MECLAWILHTKAAQKYIMLQAFAMAGEVPGELANSTPSHRNIKKIAKIACKSIDNVLYLCCPD